MVHWDIDVETLRGEWRRNRVCGAVWSSQSAAVHLGSHVGLYLAVRGLYLDLDPRHWPLAFDSLTLDPELAVSSVFGSQAPDSSSYCQRGPLEGRWSIGFGFGTALTHGGASWPAEHIAQALIRCWGNHLAGLEQRDGLKLLEASIWA
ncbi:hypothetical protein NDU88_002962 [Pleurodeles waltl]|uniref:Uncharacterized protein n=1 Tax=Pleurodeles waltl TaxID=8319 RepID=A0AAV7LLM7_PLEWA|nr:hypothetical protein NDU88_002962 [Pleurodeles waltl]